MQKDTLEQLKKMANNKLHSLFAAMAGSIQHEIVEHIPGLPASILDKKEVVYDLSCNISGVVNIPQDELASTSQRLNEIVGDMNSEAGFLAMLDRQGLIAKIKEGQINGRI